jgi:DinB family protein
MTVDVDPVRAPDAYRQSLLAALGDDDPAVVQAATPGLMRALVAEAGDVLRVAPGAGEWSALECVAHLVDGELVVSGRVRWIVAEDEPDIVGYDQDLWVTRLRQVDEDPETLLAVFEAIRRWNLGQWARSTPEQRARIGVHRERGPESYELTFRLAAGHDRVHLAQARRALAAARTASETVTPA